MRNYSFLRHGKNIRQDPNREFLEETRLENNKKQQIANLVVKTNKATNKDMGCDDRKNN